MDCIYLDNAASALPSKEVLKVFCGTAAEIYANPSALHKKGLEAEHVIKAAADDIGRLLGVSDDEIYFTSGGTESNNMAVFGLAYARKRTHRHIVTALGEHPSVMEPYKKLESEGFGVTYIKPFQNGTVSAEQIAENLRDDTGLVSIMHVNNETGSVNDIEAIGKSVKAKSGAYFFSDGVQGFGKLGFNAKYIDAYSFSGHKIHGVKGIGGLYVKKDVRLVPFILGGGQQRNLRSGTENVPGIASLAMAAKIAWESMDGNMWQVSRLNKYFREKLGRLENVHINSPEDALPYILNVSFIGVKSEVLLHALAEDGVIVSAGSACSAGKNGKAKNVINILGYGKEIYESAIRFSFSHLNTMGEIDAAICYLEKNISLLKRFVKK